LVGRGGDHELLRGVDPIGEPARRGRPGADDVVIHAVADEQRVDVPEELQMLGVRSGSSM
jgi:hypothetical protein